MLARLRPKYEQITLAFGKASASLGLGPSFWTVLGLVLAVLSGVAFANRRTLAGLILMIGMTLADMLDGATARARGTSSRFGSVLDHVTDRYAEFAIFAGLLLGNYASPFATMFTAAGVVMASYARAKAESVGGLKDCTVGVAGRLEKLMLLFLGLTLHLLGIERAVEYMMYLIGLLSHWTMAQRMLYTWQQLVLPTQPDVG